MTWDEILREGKARLEAAGVREAALDAWYLFERCFQMDRARFYLCRGEESEPPSRSRGECPEPSPSGSRGECLEPPSGSREQGPAAPLAVYREMVRKRAKRIPLQQILGTQEFMGLEFLINESVLIPRQDTEPLVETVLKENREPGLSLLDMCTGSGCIAVSLAALGNFSRVDAADISREALAVAEENAARLLRGRTPARFRESDLFSAFPRQETFDVIVSNPPYIPSRDIEELEPEVRDFEPRLALDGAGDGLAYYRRIAADSGSFLAKAGKLYLEIGCDQAGAVCGLLSQNGFRNIRVIKDLAGKDRVVCAGRG